MTARTLERSFKNTGSVSVRCTYRANTRASAAVDASVSVDNILAVSLRNSANRAALCASAASDTLIRNLVSHSKILLIIFCRESPAILLIYEGPTPSLY